MNYWNQEIFGGMHDGLTKYIHNFALSVKISKIANSTHALGHKLEFAILPLDDFIF